MSEDAVLVAQDASVPEPEKALAASEVSVGTQGTQVNQEENEDVEV